MKKRYVVLLVLVGFLFAIHSSSMTCIAAEAVGPVTLKFAAGQPETSFFGKHFKWWANEVEKRTGGQVKIQIFWLESLAKLKDMLPAVQNNFADIGMIICSTFPSNFPLYMLLEHINNYHQDYVAALLAGIETLEKEPNVKAELEKEKVVLLLPFTSGQTIIGTKKCLSSINDLKGRIVRSVGGVRTQYYKNLGANPVFLPITDTYEALDRGTVSAICDFNATLISAFKFYEVAKCWYMDNPGGAVAVGGFMNLEGFRKFSKDIQEMFIELRREYTVRFAKDLMDFESEIYRELETKHGIQYVYPSPEDKKILLEAGQKANEYLIKKQESEGHTGAQKVVDYYTNALKKYEAERIKK